MGLYCAVQLHFLYYSPEPTMSLKVQMMKVGVCHVHLAMYVMKWAHTTIATSHVLLDPIVLMLQPLRNPAPWAHTGET